MVAVTRRWKKERERNDVHSIAGQRPAVATCSMLTLYILIRLYRTINFLSHSTRDNV